MLAAVKTFTLDQFREWGRQGGHKSRRKLSSKQARAMQRLSADARRRKQRDA